MLSLLGAKPRSYVPKRAASLELLDPEDPVRRISQIFSSWTVSPALLRANSRTGLKSGIYIWEPSFPHRRHGEGNWAGTKELLEFLFGNPAGLLRPAPVRFLLQAEPLPVSLSDP